MTTEDLWLHRAVVFASALVYWGGVAVQARRVRKRIGRSPNVRPRGAKEWLLWVGWFLVVLGWGLLPFLVGRGAGVTLLPGLGHPAGLFLGVALVLAGYGGTLWCYSAMGDRWRMGVDRRERTVLVTRGPYRWVRHPIYLFQGVMLAGVVVLLPCGLSLGLLGLHGVCVWLKAADEESHLLATQGPDYRDYLARTGRLFPRFRGPSTPPGKGS